VALLPVAVSMAVSTSPTVLALARLTV